MANLVGRNGILSDSYHSGGATDCEVQTRKNRACGDQPDGECRTMAQSVAVKVLALATEGTASLTPEKNFRITSIAVNRVTALTADNYGLMSVRTDGNDRIVDADPDAFVGAALGPATAFAAQANQPVKVTLQHAVAEAVKDIVYLVTFSGTVPIG